MGRIGHGASSRRRRIAVFGGSFDPPHLGHALLPGYLFARDLADCVLVAPCFAHALGKDLSPFEDRVAMVQNTMSHYPSDRVWVSTIERELAGGDGIEGAGTAPRPSYALHLLRALAEQYPDDELRFVIGSDIISTGETAKWHRFDLIEDEFSPIVVPRAGFCPEGHAVLPDLQSREIRARLSTPLAQRSAQEREWLQRALPSAVLTRLDTPSPTARVWVVGSGHAAGHIASMLRRANPYVQVHRMGARALLDDPGGQVQLALTHGIPDGIWLLAKDSASEALSEALVSGGLNQRVEHETLVLLHAAGSRTSRSALAPWRAIGGPVGTLHPICSLRAEQSESRLRTCAWGVEGDAAAWALAERLIGDAPRLALDELDDEARRAYHAACALVANHLAVLVGQGQVVLGRLGLADQELLWTALSQLATGAMENLVALGLARGVSGPAARGELEVVQSHVDALASLDPQAASLYEQLSQALVVQLRAQASSD